jgi:DNA-binding transcriptional LysR family regulator
MDLDLRLLRSFIAIYEGGTLSRAAERLGCTQAAMSMRLKLIETEIGEMLFRRQHHRLEPTSRASELYARALGVIAAYDALVSATRSQKPRQRLRLGVPDDYAPGMLHRALARLEAENGYDIEIVCDLSANLAVAFQQQQLDFAVVTLAERPRNAICEVRIPLRWVARAGALPVAGAPVPLAVYPEGCVFRSAMIAALDMARRPWLVQVQSRTHAGVLAAVHAGLAVTSMARGTAPEGVEEYRGAGGLPELPDVPIHLLGTGPSRIAGLLQEELAGMAAPQPVSPGACQEARR